jgi:lipid II:glycine glycyltransferase (peptidoglycan interpeptide bridge formation enzyme)
VEALNDFNTLHDYTAHHHHFTRFSSRYIFNEFQVFAANGQATIFRAYLADGRLDSAAIILSCGTMACYRHGASRNLDHKIPTSYLIQWRAIQEAKNQGVIWYNFWGIAPAGAGKAHPFHGITHFKTGFGGFQKNLLHCQDLPLMPRYWLNWLVETFRRKKRGF